MQVFLKEAEFTDMLKLGIMGLITFLHWLESVILDFENEMQKVGVWICSKGNHGLCFLWHVIHLMLSMWYFMLDLVNALQSFLISGGVLKSYRDIDISKVQYLAVVIDSEDALQTLKVLELLRWLAATGLKNICLYDAEGVLKKSKEALTLWFKSGQMSNEIVASEPLLEKELMGFEVISFSDGKHAVAKAANCLFEKLYLSANTEKPDLTESNITNALEAIGYGGSEPDLMLIYGPARCHMGFPAWKIRYTEIVHMGPLQFMKFGALIKAFHRFTTVHQNYGT